MGELDIFISDVAHNLGSSGAIEGQRAGYHEKQYNAASPHIDSRVVLFVLPRQHFGSHVPESAPVGFRIEPIGHSTDPKVSHFDSLLVLQQNVLEFEVSVDDALAVAVVNRQYDLPEVVSGEVLIEPALLFEKFQQLSSF